MLDDGLHGDGAANDGVFGAEILQNSGVTQYYIYACLLYTSDAADERSSVDLGGRRIIKKKKKHTT